MLLHELNRRVSNGVAFAIDLVSAAAIRVEATEAKRALSDVVELLHGYADVHRALAMPAGDTLIHAATSIRKLGGGMRRAVLDRMNIQLAFATQSIALQPERCWHLALIVHELVMHAARHACFDARPGQIKIKLTRNGALVNCVILDNGSRPARDVSDRELRIARDIARALGGRIEQGFGTEFTSIVLSFPLTKRERDANWTIATRRIKAPRRTRAIAPNAAALVSRQTADALGGLLTLSHPTDAP
ncbi:sensor histidine kinase [Bradyrhizobium sp. Gha]|uniref:sensor histidine kinase n=1 Tax=Bradyrhizobium sp. Gha TaxID=1855318 RepID=UPI001FCDD131|nr:sensor histidine kinase [Bradyrhizobium sp. Gha]